MALQWFRQVCFCLINMNAWILPQINYFSNTLAGCLLCFFKNPRWISHVIRPITWQLPDRTLKTRISSKVEQDVSFIVWGRVGEGVLFFIYISLIQVKDDGWVCVLLNSHKVSFSVLYNKQFFKTAGSSWPWEVTCVSILECSGESVPPPPPSSSLMAIPYEEWQSLLHGILSNWHIDI